MARIKNVRMLQQRINRLKNECREMENQLERRTEHLQENYLTMAANSALYTFLKSPKSFSGIKDMFTGFWKGTTIKDFFGKLGKRLLRTLAVTFGIKFAQNFAEEKGED